MSRMKTFTIDVDSNARAWAVKWALKINEDNKRAFPGDEDQTMLLLLAGLLISAHAALNEIDVEASAKIAGMLADTVHREVAQAKKAEKRVKPEGVA